MKRYRVILADPPWPYKMLTKAKQRPGHSLAGYRTMSLAEICALQVNRLAMDDAALFLWVTDANIPMAWQVLQAWGFTYYTVGFYWVKLNTRAPTYFMGQGYATRGNPEQCWLAFKGKGLRRVDAGVRKLVVTPRGEHSAKPEEVQDRIERLYGVQPSLELFARRERPGWTCWGDEVADTRGIGRVLLP